MAANQPENRWGYRVPAGVHSPDLSLDLQGKELVILSELWALNLQPGEQWSYSLPRRRAEHIV